jgi:hydroxyquinol 1,2-dioxygenase
MPSDEETAEPGAAAGVRATFPEERLTPEGLTSMVVASFDGCPDDRLRLLLQRLVRHLHDFAVEVQLTEEEWAAAVAFLTAAGQTCSPERQELILLSDVLGLSMLVDRVHHDAPGQVTESTVLGPFYVPGSPTRPMGASVVEQEGSGDPTLVSGTVRDEAGAPVDGAVIDVWQNASNRKYAVQDVSQPAGNLRGRFRTGADGRFWFWSVRPTDYPIPDDGPVGRLLRASGRHPWRPAHLHLIVTAPGRRGVATHFFDDRSPYLGSDAVFGVKPSLLCTFVPHAPDEPGSPDGFAGTWYSVERDVVLARL